jgi:outer membrane receptor protein involved in Fe transport
VRAVPRRALFLASLLGALVLSWPCRAADNPGDQDEDLEDDELLDEFAFLEESGVVEAAARHRQAIGLSPSAITVITRDDIQATGATTLPDLLRMVPGMDVVMSSPFYAAVSSRLYWSNEGFHYLVLIDGREANLELIGQSPWSLQPIFIEDVERIEVIRGLAASLYGANAVAGVISIRTRSIPERHSAWARLSGAEIGGLGIGARVSTSLDGLGISVSGGLDRSGRFVDPRALGKEVWKARALLEYRLTDERSLSLDAGVAGGGGPISMGVGDIDGTYQLGTVRLAYRSPSLRGHLAWTMAGTDANTRQPLDYHGVRLALIEPMIAEGHTADGDVQWTLPRFWEPLLLIVGGSGRISWVDSDSFLDAETFGDLSSDRYHKPGLSWLEARGGAFVHGELAPADWVTVTAGLRFDTSTTSGGFLSPRLAAVFRPVEGQHLRLGAARAFRKPVFIETGVHPLVTFPEGSPITGTAQDRFLEFMTRVFGNGDLGNEELWSFEAGYLGQFLQDKLTVGLDLYCSLYNDQIVLEPGLVENEQGLPDLDLSTYRFAHAGGDSVIIGGELSVRYSPVRSVSLLASWAHRELFDRHSGKTSGESPKNLITLGGRFDTDWGLTGSLYAHSRSEFVDNGVDNPSGLLEGRLSHHMDNAVLFIGKLGWRAVLPPGVEMETGVKLFLPLSLASSPAFRYYEKGGGVAGSGQPYGGDELRRLVTVYLQGSY